ncbi:MAG TPA: polyprenol phosphomannose-dependent alpha 1,6 mannosyltransferase MptB [Acidimicrobiales bacterium]|nr:polyprenol phosphomannose-dependent alpha 1,6 mannosyltransferase MptB [Acidimicrobiales bacterium]
MRRDRASWPAETYRRLSAIVRARTELLFVRAEAVVAPFRDPVAEKVPYDRSDPVLRRRVLQLAVMGFLGSTLVFVGASPGSSPFTEKTPLGYAPAWFFGSTLPQSVILSKAPPPGQSFYLSLVAFYGGMVLLMRAWIRLARLARERPDMSLRLLGGVMALWSLPMLFVAPLLSKDVYSYVAQGEMTAHHISPYLYGPQILGSGANSYANLTDRLWLYHTSPYGPVFLWLGGVFQATTHSELGGLLLWRAVALVGVGLLAVFIPRLARGAGRDAGAAFVFSVMNPLVLVHLIGGEHNDALMLGLLVAGLALARERHPVLGTLLIALGGLVKAPALLGLVYVGWEWAGPEADWRRRIAPMAKVGAIALLFMAAVTQAVGLGWGWVTALGTPDALRSYLDPMTAIGLWAGDLARVLGHGGVAHLLLTVVRGTGAAIAGAIGAVLLWRSRGGRSGLRAIGLTMLAVVLLGPVMQPWYLAWGVVLLGPVAEGRLRGVLIWLTVVVTFLGIGEARWIVQEFGEANPVVVVVASIGMLALVFAPMVPKLRRGRQVLRARREAVEVMTEVSV